MPNTQWRSVVTAIVLKFGLDVSCGAVESLKSSLGLAELILIPEALDAGSSWISFPVPDDIFHL